MWIEKKKFVYNTQRFLGHYTIEKSFISNFFRFPQQNKSFGSNRKYFPILLENFYVVYFITRSVRKDFVACTHRKIFASFLKWVNSFSIQHSIFILKYTTFWSLPSTKLADFAQIRCTIKHYNILSTINCLCDDLFLRHFVHATICPCKDNSLHP